MGLIRNLVPLGEVHVRDYHSQFGFSCVSSPGSILTPSSISLPVHNKHCVFDDWRGASPLDRWVNKSKFCVHLLHNDTTEANGTNNAADSRQALADMIKNNNVANVKAHLASVNALTLSEELISIFKMMGELEEKPKKEIMDEVFCRFTQSLRAFQLGEISRILSACAVMGYADEDALETFADEVLACVDFAQYNTRAVSKFIHCLGNVYRTIGGIPTGTTNDDELLVR